MEDIRGLLGQIDALDRSAGDPKKVHEFADALREGLTRLHREFTGLREENQDLRARRASLEEQVMDMAIQPEPDWNKVIFIFGEDDDDPNTDPLPIPA